MCVSQGATVANGRSPVGELRQDRVRAGSGDRPQEGMEHRGHQTDGPARVAGTMRGVGSPGRPLRCSQGTEPWASAEAPEGQQVASRGHEGTSDSLRGKSSRKTLKVREFTVSFVFFLWNVPIHMLCPFLFCRQGH